VEFSTEIYVDPQKCATKQLLKDALSKLTLPKKIHVVDNTSDLHSFEADKEKIERVFRELIENAVEAMPQEGTLTVKSTQFDSNIQITFTDTGIGIPERIAPKIFAPLMTTKAQGIGFGLAITKRIVETHGGSLTFESQVGKGTTFTVTLPVHLVIDLEKQKAALSQQDPLLHYESKL